MLQTSAEVKQKDQVVSVAIVLVQNQELLIAKDSPGCRRAYRACPEKLQILETQRQSKYGVTVLKVRNVLSNGSTESSKRSFN